MRNSSAMTPRHMMGLVLLSRYTPRRLRRWRSAASRGWGSPVMNAQKARSICWSVTPSGSCALRASWNCATEISPDSSCPNGPFCTYSPIRFSGCSMPRLRKASRQSSRRMSMITPPRSKRRLRGISGVVLCSGLLGKIGSCRFRDANIAICSQSGTQGDYAKCCRSNEKCIIL